jgi:hypothetical protein
MRKINVYQARFNAVHSHFLEPSAFAADTPLQRRTKYTGNTSAAQLVDLVQAAKTFAVSDVEKK